MGGFRLAAGQVTTQQLLLILLLAGECFRPAREIHQLIREDGTLTRLIQRAPPFS